MNDPVMEAIENARQRGELSHSKVNIVFWEEMQHLPDGRQVPHMTSVRVCCMCLAAPAWDSTRCYGCERKLEWERLCPPKYRRYASIDQLGEGPDPWTADEVARLRGWLDATDAGPTLGLISPQPGRRKTTAAFAVIGEMLELEDHTVKYCTAAQMLRDLQARRFEVDALQDYTDPSILFLDELGDRDDALSEDRRALLQEVIEQRYAWEKVLIWTSNLPLKDLRAWCHPRTWERLWDNGVVVQVTGKSSRRLAA